MSITRQERTELLGLIRKREKVMKAGAEERAAKMLADFEAEISAIYAFDDDEIWKAAVVRAGEAVKAANADIAERCKALGIPKEFAPRINLSWYERGQNAVRDRRTELRAAAKSRIAAVQAEAERKIERISLEAQTELLSSGLMSEAAKQFISDLSTVDSLMPAIEATAIRQEVEEKKKRGHRHIGLITTGYPSSTEDAPG